jgi:5-formyltetrahydrofolate cyclo-ligase
VPPVASLGDPPAPVDDRPALRRDLLARRVDFMRGPHADDARRALARHLRPVLAQLEPACLGLYWPVRGELSAGVSPFEPLWPDGVPYALPWATRGTAERPPAMTYRRWHGPAEPPARDGFGLPSGDGPPVEPDVVLVPCVGFTGEGFRLGYGAGCFDRWLDAHPGVTAIGIAWSGARLAAGVFTPRPHDRPLDLVVTEAGVVG